MLPTPVRVFLVDDHEVVRRGVAEVLEDDPGITVAGEAGSAAEALARVPAVRPDVVLIDMRLPDGNGADLTRDLRKRVEGLYCLVLTSYSEQEALEAAVRAGAAGFLLKDARQEELRSAVRAVAGGGAVVAPSATRRMLAHVVDALPDPSAPPDDRRLLLTPRETEVLQAIAAGATNAEIAARLHMAEGTVKTHIGNLLSKLHCRDRVALVLFAFQTGLAGPARP